MITMDPVINDPRTNCGRRENKAITSFISSKCSSVYNLSSKNHSNSSNLDQPCDLLYPKSPTYKNVASVEKSESVAEKRKMPKYSTRSLYSSPALDYGSATDMINEMRSLDSLTTSITTSQIVTSEAPLLPGTLKECNLSKCSSKWLHPVNNDECNDLRLNLTSTPIISWNNSVNASSEINNPVSTSSSITCKESSSNIGKFNLEVSSRGLAARPSTLNQYYGVCDNNLKQLTSFPYVKTGMAMKCFECSFSTLDRLEISKHYTTAHSKDLKPPHNNLVVTCTYAGPRRGSAPIYPINSNPINSRTSLRPSQHSLATSLNTLPKTFSVSSQKWSTGGESEPKNDNNNELQCFECTFTTISKSSMISHYNTAHASLWSTYNCFLCDTSAESKPEIATHIYEQHFFRSSYDNLINGDENNIDLTKGRAFSNFPHPFDTIDRKNVEHNLLNTLLKRHSSPLIKKKIKNHQPNRFFQPSTELLPKFEQISLLNRNKRELDEWFHENKTHLKLLHDKLGIIFHQKNSDDFESQHASSSGIIDIASLLTKIMSNQVIHLDQKRPTDTSYLLMNDISTMDNIQNTQDLNSVRLPYKSKFGDNMRASTYLFFRKCFIHKIFKRKIVSPFRRRSTIIKSGHSLSLKTKLSASENELIEFQQPMPSENDDPQTHNLSLCVESKVHFYCPIFYLYNVPAKRINGDRSQGFPKKSLGLMSQKYLKNANSPSPSPPSSSIATEVFNEVFEEPLKMQNLSEQTASIDNFLKLSSENHGGSRLYPCPLRNKIGCSFKTRNKKRWADHLDHHNGLKNHSCKSCPYKTTWYENLKQHTKRMHVSAPTLMKGSLKCKSIYANKIEENGPHFINGKPLNDKHDTKRHVLYSENQICRNTISGVNKMNKRKSAPLKFVGREEKVVRLERMESECRDRTLAPFRKNLEKKSIYPQIINRFRHPTYPPVSANRHTVYKHKLSRGNYITKFHDDIKKEQGSLATLLRGSKDLNTNKSNLNESQSSANLNPLHVHEAFRNVDFKTNENLKRAYGYLVEMNDCLKRTVYEDLSLNGKSGDIITKDTDLNVLNHDSVPMDQKVSDEFRLEHSNASAAYYRDYLKRFGSSNIYAPNLVTVSKDSQINSPWNIFPYYLPPFTPNHQVIGNPDVGQEQMWMNHYHLPFMTPTTETPSYPLLCTLCSTYFKTFPDLMTHYQNVHGIMPPRPDFNNNVITGKSVENEAKYSPDHCSVEVSNIMKRVKSQESLPAAQDMLHHNWLPTAPLQGLLPPPYHFNMAAAAAAFYNNPESLQTYTRMFYGKEQEMIGMQKNSRKNSTESQESGSLKHQTHKERHRSITSSTGSGVHVKNNYIKDHLRYMARKGSLTSDNTSESSSKAHALEDATRYENTCYKGTSPPNSIKSAFQIKDNDYKVTSSALSLVQNQLESYQNLNDRVEDVHMAIRDEKIYVRSPVSSNKASKNASISVTHHRTGGNGLYCSAAASYLPTPESLLLVMSHAGSKQNTAGNANNGSPHLDFAEPRLASEHISNLEGTILPGGLGPYDPLDPAHQQYLLSLGVAAGPNAKRQRTHRCTLPGCNFEAYDKNRMLDHLAAHRGEKPHGCPYCEFRTSWRFNIKNHIRSKHPNML